MTELIEHIADLIESEINGADGYVLDAIRYKNEYPATSKVFYDIATDELRHVNMLHGEVTKFIEMCKKEQIEPPAPMLAVYDYLHKKHIKASNAVKVMMQQY